jgi:competence protein ComEA
MRTTFCRLAGIVALASLLAVGAPLAAAERVNLNTATQEELVALPGVGPAKAKAIIDYRTAHPFKTVDEVKNVRGIGDHLYESLKGKITVGAMASSAAPGDKQ